MYLCETVTTIKTMDIFITPNVSLCPLGNPNLQSTLALLCPQANTHLLFITTDGFAFSRILCKGNHTLSDLFVRFLIFNIIILKFTHVIACINSSLLTNYNIISYIQKHTRKTGKAKPLCYLHRAFSFVSSFPFHR